MGDKEYIEWHRICQAYCDKHGAELLFVNSDSFGMQTKEGELHHIYAEELLEMLKNEKKARTQIEKE